MIVLNYGESRLKGVSYSGDCKKTKLKTGLI